MECAGDYSGIPDAERKGLGTPATRAGVIERLVKVGFIERRDAKKAKHLLPTERGMNLITILPEVIKSPELTAEWEGKLKQVERGELPGASFMAGITELVNALVKGNSAPDPAHLSFFPANKPEGKVVGNCPRCGQPVREGGKGFFCDNKACHFALWKDNKYFASKKKTLTVEIAAALLKDGRARVTGLYSDRTKKTYDAVIVLDDTGEKWVNFKLEFEQDKK